jgi:hypothetical protein
MKFNEFHTDLEYSLNNRENEMFDEFYFRAFPSLARIELVEDLHLQKRGVDKILHLKNTKQILIDEKKRRKDYGDILLEEYSNWERKVVGWLGRDKHTDYIVYAFMDTKRVVLLPFLLLQRAWLANYHDWSRDYPRKFAKNKGYTTSNIPIPNEVLFSAIKRAAVDKLAV